MQSLPPSRLDSKATALVRLGLNECSSEGSCCDAGVEQGGADWACSDDAAIGERY